MRYSSSRTAAAAHQSQPLHFKKDGSLDMRYSSSKAIAVSSVSGRASEGGLHYKKDGTLDMRYASSKRVEMERAMADLQFASSGAGDGGGGDIHQSAREAYYQSMAEENERYRTLVEQLSQREVPCQATEVLPFSEAVAAYLREHHLSTCEPAADAGGAVGSAATAAPSNDAAAVTAAEATRMQSVTSALPSTIRQLTKDEVDACTSGQEELGRGAFGLVYKGCLDHKDVAVKVLFVSQLQRNERGAFEKELIILGHLGTHINLVQLHAYSLEKPAFVMELVALGSLHHNLYFNNDETVTATLSTSGTKKKILVGILSGIVQLHHVGIVHGDLKPHNVLLTEDFVAKITDFGLSRLRAKASSLTGKHLSTPLAVTIALS
jgi:predicted Ser/Thr protein kinase